jgi:phenylalanyl-tRNA synthetase alpha chain
MEVDSLRTGYDRDAEAVATVSDVVSLRNKYLGKKGEVKVLIKEAGKKNGEEKRRLITMLNDLSRYIEESLGILKEKVLTAEISRQIKEEWVDLSLPGVGSERGSIHPLSRLEGDCVRFLANIGYEYVEGPEVETPFYNFDALNIPEHHPARDMQDTFWLENDLLLRSHTSTVQIRTLEKKRGLLPVRIVSPGRVYRNEAVDASHLASFHQLEGLCVDKRINFKDLKGTLEYIIYKIYDRDLWNVRFKPKFYPYTEPSLGVDVSLKDGAHGEKKWTTVLGAGLVHPNVFRTLGYDTKEVSGFAFGLGLSRIVAQLHGVKSLRSLYDLDLRVHRAIAHKAFLVKQIQ